MARQGRRHRHGQGGASAARTRRWLAGVGRACGLLAALHALPAGAGPAEDHQRGLLAYHRADVVGAMAALRPAAQAGHAPSQALLAFILDRADFSEEAFTLYRSAAAAGDAEGHAGLANAYLTGRGVAKDEKLAVAHFSKAADLGHTGAALVLASAWAGGQMGLVAEAEPGAARLALQRAADAGHLASAEALARAFARGQLGQAADAVEAARWQARASALRQQQRQAAVPAKATR